MIPVAPSPSRSLRPRLSRRTQPLRCGPGGAGNGGAVVVFSSSCKSPCFLSMDRRPSGNDTGSPAAGSFQTESDREIHLATSTCRKATRVASAVGSGARMRNTERNKARLEPSWSSLEHLHQVLDRNQPQQARNFHDIPIRENGDRDGRARSDDQRDDCRKEQAAVGATIARAAPPAPPVATIAGMA